MEIPFNKPYLDGKELDFISQAVQSRHISGDGIFTQKCHELLERDLGVRKVLLTTSCTHALELAALLLNLKSGDEIIVPAFSFVSTANAFLHNKSKIVFADVRPDTLNIDEKLLEAKITPKTRAIVLVHYTGVGCEMETISKIARNHKIAVIEDNAHGLYGKYNGQYLGTFGQMSAVSFHETKNVSCGEGGAIFINDPQFIKRAEIIREKGTNRSQFLRGEIDKYTWVDIGSSYLPSDILAAFLYAQLRRRDSIQQRRARIWNRYFRDLSGWAQSHDIGINAPPANCEQSYHNFYIIMPSEAKRRNLIRHLQNHNIQAVFHYLPLHLSNMGKSFGGKPGDCPVTEHVCDRLLRLPFYNDFNKEEQDYVIHKLLRWPG